MKQIRGKDCKVKEGAVRTRIIGADLGIITLKYSKRRGHKQMNTTKNKNTPNPSNGSIYPNTGDTKGTQSRDRDNAIENIKKTHPTKK